MKNVKAKVYSFDVFDTVLTRLVGEPTSLFLLLGQRLLQQGLISISAEAFYHARISAERLAFANDVQYSQPGLFEIYRQLQYELGLTDAVTAQIMQIEMDLEREFLRPVPKTSSMVEEARQMGVRIIFVSDMYLPASFLKEILTEHQLMRYGDGLYVSCEYKASKGNGLLFKKILELENIQPDEMVHCGDNDISDMAVPRKMGIKVVPFTEAHLNRYEKLMETFTLKTMGASSRMAGASRYSRLCVAASNQREQVIRDVTAGVAAPILTGYVLWILDQAQAKGLKRLYFVSRDGEVLLEIAKILKQRLNLWPDIELRYLYGGRQAWHLAALRDFDEMELSSILDISGGINLRALFLRVELNPEDIRSFLEKYKIEKADWNKEVDEYLLSNCKSLFSDHDFRRLILNQGQNKKDLVLRYLRQEGLFDSVRFGMVDLGWFGRIQVSLKKIMSQVANNTPEWFYWGLHPASYSFEITSRNTFVYDEHNRLGFSTLPFSMITLLEVFCSGAHGVVLGYEPFDERVRPRLKEEKNTAVKEWGLDILRKSILSFCEHLPLNQMPLAFANSRELVVRLFQEFFTAPDGNEASVWGSFPFDNDQGSNCSYPFAMKLGGAQVLEVLFHRKVISSPSYQAWPQGSSRVTPRIILMLLDAPNYIILIPARCRRILAKVKRIIVIWMKKVASLV